MKKFMVVCKSETKQWSSFFDSYEQASEYKMNAECGIGAYAEVYKYQDETEGECGAYEFLYS